MKFLMKSTFTAVGLALATQAAAQIVLYEHDDFQGRSFSAETQANNFERLGFNDRASSVVVMRERWEICTDANFNGQCVVLRAGRYSSLNALGLNDRISSMRPVSTNVRVEDNRFAPAPLPVYDNHRRRDERLYEARVTSVRAVYGSAEQRCWVEREQVSQQGGANVPGAIVGGLLGGVIGHQVGSGRGNDVATVGGAVVGAAIGANTGRDNGGGYQDVRRCENVATNGRPDHWDVTYDDANGYEHRMQTTMPPGPTVTVNDRGEPRS